MCGRPLAVLAPQCRPSSPALRGRVTRVGWPIPSGIRPCSKAPRGRAAEHNALRSCVRRQSSSERRRFSAGLFGVRRFDPWALRGLGRFSYPPLRRWPSGQQCDKRARAVPRDRSGCMDAVAVSSSPRACGSKLRAPSSLFGGAPAALRSGHWGALRSTPHGLSWGQARFAFGRTSTIALDSGLVARPRSLERSL